MALNRTRRDDQRFGSERPAAPPAGHRVRLRCRTADHANVTATSRDDARKVVWDRTVDQLLVAEIDDEPDALTTAPIGNRIELRLADDGSRRVARRVDDDAPRA